MVSGLAEMHSGQPWERHAAEGRRRVVAAVVTTPRREWTRRVAVEEEVPMVAVARRWFAGRDQVGKDRKTRG